MKINKEHVDKVLEEMADFGNIIPGINNGYDYPELALAVLGSSGFEALVKGSFTMSLLQIDMYRPQLVATLDAPTEYKERVIDSMLKTCIQRDELLRAIYLGFKLGQLSKEKE